MIDRQRNAFLIRRWRHIAFILQLQVGIFFQTAELVRLQGNRNYAKYQLNPVTLSAAYNIAFGRTGKCLRVAHISTTGNSIPVAANVSEEMINDFQIQEKPGKNDARLTIGFIDSAIAKALLTPTFILLRCCIFTVSF
jgi:hypothetical protein